MRTTLWRHADFRNLWLAQSASLIGTQVTLLALPLAGLLLGASALEVSLVAAIEFVPVLLFGLPAGAWLERMRRLPVLIATDIVRAAALISVPVAYTFDMLTMPLLYVVAFIIGLGTLFFDVAQLSILPSLIAVDQLNSGNAKLETSRSAAQVVGPGAGGFLIQLLTAPVAIAVDALSYLVSAGFLLAIRQREKAATPTQRVGLRREIVEGLRFVFGHPLVRPLALCTLAADLAFAAILALFVVFADNVLNLSPGVIGLVFAIGNVGGVLGGIASNYMARRLGFGNMIIGSVALFSLGATMLPLAGSAIGLTAGLFITCLGVVIFNVLQTTLCQQVTPAGLLGRMNATMRFISWGTVPVGAAAGGLMVEHAGLRGVFWIAAAVCATSVLPLLLSSIRGYRTAPDVVADSSDGPAHAESSV